MTSKSVKEESALEHLKGKNHDYKEIHKFNLNNKYIGIVKYFAYLGSVISSCDYWSQ